LAIVAGLVIAEPLVLIVFRSEVNAQATADTEHAFLLQKQHLDQQYAAIGTLTSQANSIEQQLTNVDAGSVLLTDPEYRLASQQAQSLQSRAQAAEQQALCELDGSCGTHHVGSGPVYDAKQAQANQLKQQAAAAQAKLATLGHSLIAQQTARQGQGDRYLRSQLAQSLERRGQLQAQRAQDESTLRAAYRQPIGLAERLDALSEVSHQHPSVAAMSLLITLLILLIDSAPALGKAFISIGTPTLYEQVQTEEERSALDHARARRQALAEAQAHEAAAIVDEAEIHRRLWKQALKHLVGQMVQTQRHVAEGYIDRWAEDARAGMHDWTEASLRERATPSYGPSIDENLFDVTRNGSRSGVGQNGHGSFGG
jgi:hypothetical protein